MVDESELKSEQAYFEIALECLESALARQKEAAANAADNKARNELLKRAGQARDDAAQAFEKGVAFGRVDFSDPGAQPCDEEGRCYVGYTGISQRSVDFPLVLDWRADAALPYFEASHTDQVGVAVKRTYSCEGNTILDVEDLHFEHLADRVEELLEPEVGDVLLNELNRNRSGSLQDIVRTIQAAQHEIIRRDLDRLLVVQGGPGTGKSVVALHRVSWLLFPRGGGQPNDLQPEDVLVVGPNPAFVNYIRDLLPTLGNREIRHEAINRLGAGGLKVSRSESPETSRLKGELRMKALLERGLRDRVSSLTEADFSSDGRGRALPRLDVDRLEAVLERAEEQSYTTGRSVLRSHLQAELERRVDPGMLTDVVNLALDRIWPQLTPVAFLQDLLGSEARLLRAASGDFTAQEVQLMYRRAAANLREEVWSEADVALLDYADHLISGPGQRFRHIVVDEAQDLSPMQLQSIGRRSENGSMTVLGDMAQSTGPWARDDWAEVSAILKGRAPEDIAELQIGYRVPRESYRLAAELLPVIAPSVAPPRVVRSGTDPKFVRVPNAGARAEAVVSEARTFASHGEMVGIICTDESRNRIVQALDEHRVTWRDIGGGQLGAGINLVDPTSAKGLEFDAVIVVEPEQIVASDERGGRLLYVALTRTTRHLSIVHIGNPTPFIGDAPTEPEPAQTAETPEVRSSDTTTESAVPSTSTAVPRVVQSLAEVLAADIRQSLLPQQIPLLLAALERALQEPRSDEEHGT